MISISSSVSCGVSTAVGSSKTSTLASRDSALMISTRCCTPTGRSSTSGIGVDVEAEPRRRSRATRCAGGVEVEAAAEALVGSWPSMTFSATVKTGMSMKCWCTMPMPAAHGVAGTGEVLDLVVEQDLALVGLVEAVEHVHQRGLAGAVLAEQAVDLAGLDREVDVVVGDQVTEALGDAAEFELHGVAS